MFKVHPVEEHEIAKVIYPDLKDTEQLFVVNEEGRFTGIGIAEISSDTVIIKRVTAPYNDARFLLFDDILNYAERRGTKRAVCIDKSLKDICDRMGFNVDMTVSLEGFFKPGAHCLHE